MIRGLRVALRIGLALAVTMDASNSAAARYGETERLVIESIPADAEAVVRPYRLRCFTPCTVVVPRRLPYVVDIRKEDYRSAVIEISAGSDRRGEIKGLHPNPVRVILERASPRADSVPGAASPATPSAAATQMPPNCIQPAIIDRETCAGRLKLEAPRQDVIALLGEPDGWSRDGAILRYGDRYLKFDGNDKLIAISDQPK